MEDRNPQIHEVQLNLSGINKKKHTAGHVIVKLQHTRDNDTVKATRETRSSKKKKKSDIMNYRHKFLLSIRVKTFFPLVLCS